MELTLLLLDVLYSAMIKLGRVDELPTNIRICIRLNTQRIESDVRTYHAMRDELVQKYGEIGSDGRTSISPTSDKWEEFQKEYLPLNNQKVTCNFVALPCTYTSLLEKLLECETVNDANLSSAEIDLLSVICKVKDNKEESIA